MDNNASVLSVQRGERKFNGFRLLKRIDEHNTSAPRLKWIWERMLECDYAFNDFSRGKVEYFLAQFQDPDVEFFEVGDSGVAVLSNITAKGTCEIHYLIWDRTLDLTAKRKPVVELFDYIFYERQVHHLVGMIPSNNMVAVRFATSVGMKFEGEIRENFLYYDKYYPTHIYGMLDREYDNCRARLL